MHIQVVANHIDDVEAFGDLSGDSRDKIAKIICRNRKLNNSTARLFYEPTATEITLYDCSSKCLPSRSLS